MFRFVNCCISHFPMRKKESFTRDGNDEFISLWSSSTTLIGIRSFFWKFNFDQFFGD